MPSDALIFYLKQIPLIMFFTGSHPEYHTHNDRPDLISYPALAEIAGMVRDHGVALASQATSPLKYEKVEGQQKGSKGSGRSFRLYLGTIPDDRREGVQGVAISGASKGSTSEQAGDVILELGGMSIKNINDYVYCLQALRANEKTKMRVLRAGAEKELEITPVLKTAR